MISFADWMMEMKLDTLKLWFSSLPSVMVQSIMETTMSQLTQARDRDLLLCILTISLTPSTTKFLVPSCMSLDETSRLYVLELLCTETTWESLHTFCCECYKPGSIHYMSQQEESLLCSAVRRMPRLRYLSLQVVASQDLVEAISNSCPRLQILDLSNSRLDDTMVDILVGEARILKKGDLVKVVKVKGKAPLILSELRLIDVRWTKIGFSGFQVLRKFLNSALQILR